MSTTPADLGRTVLSKVPEATLAFWIIKVTSTGMGEVVADASMQAIDIPLTAVITGLLMAAALWWQFRQTRYRALPYWTTVGTVSLFGTAVGDGPRRWFGFSFLETTLILMGALAVVFVAWYLLERTLSIHTITTRRREAFYWSVVLLTFAMGTAVGDLLTNWGLPFLVSAAILLVLMLVAYGSWRWVHLNSVIAFWFAYVLTRPLGASLADWSWVPAPYGAGLGKPLAGLITSALFLGMLVYMVISRNGEPPAEQAVASVEPAVEASTAAADERTGDPQQVRAGDVDD